MQHFRGANAINNLAIKTGGEFFANFARQGLSRRRTHTQLNFRFGRQICGREHASKSGRCAKKHSDSELLPQPKYIRRDGAPW